MKQSPKRKEALVVVAPIEPVIQVIRGQKVILDADLAEIYGVTTKRLNEQVKRNRRRFADDFMFRLKREESQPLQRSRSQFATLTTAHTKALQKEERKLAASFQIDPRITAPSCIPASQNLNDSDVRPDSIEDLKILSHHKPSNSAPLADLRMTFGKET